MFRIFCGGTPPHGGIIYAGITGILYNVPSILIKMVCVTCPVLNVYDDNVDGTIVKLEKRS